MPDVIVRERILDWAHQQIVALVGTDIDKAYRNLTSPPDSDDPKSIVLFDGEERPADAPTGTNVLTLDLYFAVVVHQNKEDDLGPAINAVLLALSRKLFTDRSCGGLAIDLRYAGVGGVVTDKTKGAPPMMGMIAMFQVDYWTDEDDLAVTT